MDRQTDGRTHESYLEEGLWFYPGADLFIKVLTTGHLVSPPALITGGCHNFNGVLLCT